MTTIERFEREYQAYNDLDPQRRREQLRALGLLCASSGLPEPQHCTAEQYREWLRTLSESNLKPSTVRWYGMMVRPFFGWAFDAGLYTGEELTAIKRAEFPDQPKSLPRPYSSKEIKRLWPAIHETHPLNTDPKWLARYLRGSSKFGRVEHDCNNLQLTAVLRIALECGLRRAEIFDLAIDDMHYDNAYIVVRQGKGDKFREVPYTKTAKEAVRQWIERRTEMKPKHDRPWLALTRIGPRGTAIRPMNFKRFSMYAHDAGQWELHRLRHTCATGWLRAGMRLELVSRLLGHANLQQTLVYTELLRDDLQRDVERFEEKFRKQIE